MNRRDSLRALGLLAAGSAAILTNNSCNTSPGENVEADAVAERLPGVQEFEYERTKKIYEEKFFTDHEIATITVLGDIILPKDDVSPSASEVGVPEFIEFIVKDLPDHKIPMRGGLKWLDVYALNKYDNVFIECKPEEQIAIVEEIAYPAKARPEVSQGVTFFNRMRDLTASGYYTSKEGIADLGYVGNRPGVWTGVPPEILKEHGFEVS